MPECLSSCDARKWVVTECLTCGNPKLISASATPAASPRPEQRSPKGRQADPVDVREPQAITGAQRARVGRPLARSLRRAGRKEKVTFRINSDLIAQYRDWSWEARCQLGELVE